MAVSFFNYIFFYFCCIIELRKDRCKVKRERVLMIMIVILIVIVIGMGIKIYVMSNEYKEQQNILSETEKEIDLIKQQIEERCPDQFHFVDEK